VPEVMTSHDGDVKKVQPSVSQTDDQTAANTTLQGISIDTKNVSKD
jgi:hypothetical protein